jgi:hypothetical protein
LGKDVDVAKDAAAGYHVCLDQLIELLDIGTSVRWKTPMSIGGRIVTQRPWPLSRPSDGHVRLM